MSRIIESGPADKEDGLQIHDRITEVCNSSLAKGKIGYDNADAKLNDVSCLSTLTEYLCLSDRTNHLKMTT